MYGLIDSMDLSSRRKRRAAVAVAVRILRNVRSAEELSLGRFPENLQGGDAYADAEFSLEVVDDAVEILFDAY
jgi:hypothetical protein